ncbi:MULTISPECIES: helix-turn-helix transcriptional regulator [unclassified Lactobacillus]|uniref:helix-turn-helix domain-containing protein n=1 Tax=unclassified Lactobacillus TaxID=2620435 RepID=UPI000EFD7B44|nr:MULTISPECIES: helix-turn-helix transcriptional regulator [unclassified Lactobacillus]RMC24456.1 XRE family transcriptional regulator [Lactobacillus sp. ESL0247]RMC28595.1 XRE family transcriptional regulator [Lactobacillus sp. ESL0246]RMC31787.1 XRE family transcriptional regulator [Lactobacillus sp. ESL0245]
MKWSNVQKFLDMKHWSQRVLSEKSGIPITTLDKYKFYGNEPSFTNACKIADALEISLDELREEEN